MERELEGTVEILVLLLKSTIKRLEKVEMDIEILIEEMVKAEIME